MLCSVHVAHSGQSTDLDLEPRDPACLCLATDLAQVLLSMVRRRAVLAAIERHSRQSEPPVGTMLDLGEHSPRLIDPSLPAAELGQPDKCLACHARNVAPQSIDGPQ